MSAAIDHWLWRAHLTDGRIISETEPDGREHGWLDVPAGSVRAIELVPISAGRAPVWLDVPEGAAAWLARRRSIRLPADGGPQERLASLTILRWTLGERAVWLFVGDDGTVAAADRDITEGG